MVGLMPRLVVRLLLLRILNTLASCWVKRLFIDRQFIDNERPEHFGFVQAKVYDNKALMDVDPDYVQRLEDLPEDKRRAYLDGDWDVFSGQVFAEFRRDVHVMSPVVPKADFVHYLSIDWDFLRSIMI